MVNNSFLTFIIGDFNAKLSLWYNNSITTFERSITDGVTSQLGLQHIIKKPKHILGGSLSCIDFSFISHLNLVMESEVHFSLRQLSSRYNVCQIQS